MDRISAIHKLESWLYNHHLKIAAQILRGVVRIFFSADIPPQMLIGEGTVFPHDALGCVFHPAVKIGRNCKILHGVTIGGRAGHLGLPTIGDNVVIGAHAQIIGNVTIGNNSIVGAGAIVIHDVPDNVVVVGNPAKVIKEVSGQISDQPCREQ